jgi:hypothetical protein
MLWETLLCALWMEAPELARAVAAAFDVPSAAILVVDDLRELENNAVDRVSLIVRRVPTSGDFRMQLTIIPQVKGLEGDATDRGMALSRALNMAVLLPDDEDDGDGRWIALSPDGPLERVQLDGARLNLDDIHVVQREAPVRVPVLS